MSDYQGFLKQVRENLGIEDRLEAVRATEAVLKTLGERLSEEEANRLAHRLPQEIGLYLTVVDMNQPYDLLEFYEHVSRRGDVDLNTAREHTQAVFGAVAESVPAGELREVLLRLPEEFEKLFA